jgi:DNA polymerase elongation subunit (family B)
MENNTDNADIFALRYINLSNKVKDLSQYTLEQLKELEHEANIIKKEYDNLQLVVKCDANSLYGVSASKYFSLHDTDIAEDITMGGKFFAVKVDHALNKKLQTWGQKELEIIQIFYPQVIRLRKFTEYVPDTKNDFCAYGDTDSRYCCMDLFYSLMETESGIMELPEDDEELSNFTTFINERIIALTIKETIDYECEMRNARKGHLKMAHEVTTRKSIFLKKKKYILALIMKDGKFFKIRKLKLTGVELKKGSSSGKIKAILSKIVEKYLINNESIDKLRNDLIKIISYIKGKSLIDHIYLITSVSGLKDITFKDGRYTSEKTHIQIQIALSWMNFIHENKLTEQYKIPFEGQKMLYYYCDENSKYKVIGMPDDVDINEIKNILPKPDYNKMLLNYALIKPFLRYTLDKETIDDADTMNFLLGVKPVDQY